MIRLALLGATGRMGTRVRSLLPEDSRFELVAALTASDDPRVGETVAIGARRVTLSDDTDSAFDVLVDFSRPGGTVSWLDQCQRLGACVVSGVTGHTEEQLTRISDAAGRVAVLHASNFSIGVNVMLSLVGGIARRLGDAYEIEIVEKHHSKKIDAPSGTAYSMIDAIADATGRDRRADVTYGRCGAIGPRPPRQIGVHALRMGDVVGGHTVHFSGPGETITVQHVAHSRDAFARGALEAAAWIHGKPPGMYTMNDVFSAG